jgi:hypothetical protein
MENATDVPEQQRIEKTVFVKAPRASRYGEVVKVIDAIKGAGANPIFLQVDDLPRVFGSIFQLRDEQDFDGPWAQRELARQSGQSSQLLATEDS